MIRNHESTAGDFRSERPKRAAEVVSSAAQKLREEFLSTIEGASRAKSSDQNNRNREDLFLCSLTESMPIDKRRKPGKSDEARKEIKEALEKIRIAWRKDGKDLNKTAVSDAKEIEAGRYKGFSDHLTEVRKIAGNPGITAYRDAVDRELRALRHGFRIEGGPTTRAGKPEPGEFITSYTVKKGKKEIAHVHATEPDKDLDHLREAWKKKNKNLDKIAASDARAIERGNCKPLSDHLREVRRIAGGPGLDAYERAVNKELKQLGHGYKIEITVSLSGKTAKPGEALAAYEVKKNDVRIRKETIIEPK
jgi:hypothetical protein